MKNVKLFEEYGRVMRNDYDNNDNSEILYVGIIYKYKNRRMYSIAHDAFFIKWDNESDAKEFKRNIKKTMKYNGKDVKSVFLYSVNDYENTMRIRKQGQ